MEQYSRILVALDFTEADKYIIEFLHKYKKQLFSDATLYFLHVVKDLTVPEEVMTLMGSQPGDEAVLDMMREGVLEQTGDEEFTGACDYITAEGNVTDQLQHWTEVKKADLVIVGQKEHPHGTGLAANRFARGCHCDMLFLPSRSVDLKNILVPVDFSKHCQLALDRAKRAASLLPDSSVHCLNVYTVHFGYSKVGKTYEEMAEIMKGHAERELKGFVNSFQGDQSPLIPHTALAKDHHYADAIQEVADANDIDLVIMGSKGQTFVSWMMLGSVAEKTILLSTHIPLLIVKQKDENFGFWKAIKQV